MPDKHSVLVVDDEPSSVGLLRITLGMDHKVYEATDGEAALQILADHPEIGLAIIDQRMPGMTGAELIQRTSDRYPELIRIILTGYTDFDSLVEAINGGHVYRYLTKPWNKGELAATVRQGLDLYDLTVENRRLQEELRVANEHLRVENVHLKREAKGKYRFEGIVGNSSALQKMLGLVERVAQTDTTVLITGETGTGKELIARAVHYNSARADKPFVTENCGAIAQDLLTSELFGHKRGAFTGALEDRKGLFEVANGGTIFLDEIGDCPAELQTRLLRVLDQGEIRRVGESKPIKIDVRVLAATHHDLEQDVEAGTFRRDLLYRLSVFHLVTPPLRERKEDLPLLVQHALDRLNAASGRGVLGFTTEALAALSVHDFPGNVRELQNEVERAYALADADSYITPDLLSPKLQRDTPAVESTDGSLRGAVEQFEAQLVREGLERSGGNQTKTAVDLGLSRRALIDKIQKYALR